MRILVAGGAFFIGSHYVRTLISGGYPGFADARVTVLDKLTYAGNLANLQAVASHPRFTFIRGDICDAARCANNYGPYQFPEKVIPLFATNLLDELAVPLYGDGGNVRGWIHVDNHCRGIQLVLERGQGGGIYHISGDVKLTNIQRPEARAASPLGAP